MTTQMIHLQMSVQMVTKTWSNLNNSLDMHWYPLAVVLSSLNDFNHAKTFPWQLEKQSISNQISVLNEIVRHHANIRTLNPTDTNTNNRDLNCIKRMPGFDYTFYLPRIFYQTFYS